MRKLQIRVVRGFRGIRRLRGKIEAMHGGGYLYEAANSITRVELNPASPRNSFMVWRPYFDRGEEEEAIYYLQIKTQSVVEAWLRFEVSEICMGREEYFVAQTSAT